jgi:hypothetical protein
VLPEGYAVDPTPIVTTHAPVRSTAKPSRTIERYVGEIVAAAAGAIMEALAEYQTGGLTAATKSRGGDLIAELYGLRQYMIVDWPFDQIAREHGATVLRETCGTDLDARRIDVLVDEVLRLLHKVVRAAVN